MKRDMELIRALMLDIEGETEPDLAKWTEDQQLYHMALLVQAGLAHGDVLPDEDGGYAGARITALTWQGHEFLDAARNDTVWRKALARIKSLALDLTLPLLMESLQQIGRDLLLPPDTAPR